MLVNQIESIRFALDWIEIGQHVGGKSFKKKFADTVQTGRPAPTSKNASKQECREYKLFKSKHQRTIRSRNYLLDLYTKVRSYG